MHLYKSLRTKINRLEELKTREEFEAAMVDLSEEEKIYLLLYRETMESQDY